MFSKKAAMPKPNRMIEAEISFREQVARVQISQFKSYLLGRGWEEKPSRYSDHLYFQGALFDDCSRYELYLPASTRVPRSQSNLLQAIYKLCGIEDREPAEITRDVLASEPSEPVASSVGGTARLRIRNSGVSPLRLRINLPSREHRLLPGEAIELLCDVTTAGGMEIEHGETTLGIRSTTNN
jgi:hypothetical protein